MSDAIALLQRLVGAECRSVTVFEHSGHLAFDSRVSLNIYCEWRASLPNLTLVADEALANAEAATSMNSAMNLMLAGLKVSSAGVQPDGNIVVWLGNCKVESLDVASGHEAWMLSLEPQLAIVSIDQGVRVWRGNSPD